MRWSASYHASPAEVLRQQIAALEKASENLLIDADELERVAANKRSAARQYAERITTHQRALAVLEANDA